MLTTRAVYDLNKLYSQFAMIHHCHPYASINNFTRNYKPGAARRVTGTVLKHIIRGFKAVKDDYGFSQYIEVYDLA